MGIVGESGGLNLIIIISYCGIYHMERMNFLVQISFILS